MYINENLCAINSVSHQVIKLNVPISGNSGYIWQLERNRLKYFRRLSKAKFTPKIQS